MSKYTLWRKEFKEQEYGICKYCKFRVYKKAYNQQSPLGWNKEHICPKSKGGSNDLKNLRVCHCWCNNFRGNKKIKNITYNDFKNHYLEQCLKWKKENEIKELPLREQILMVILKYRNNVNKNVFKNFSEIKFETIFKYVYKMKNRKIIDELEQCFANF